MASDDTRKKIEELREQIELECVVNELDSLKDSRHRSRNLTVGTCFGGVVNVAMNNEHYHMYCQLQPTEAIEIIEQLAAGVGVELVMRPKQNFASWRGWEEVIDQRIAIGDLTWKGAAAHQLQQAHEPEGSRPSLSAERALADGNPEKRKRLNEQRDIEEQEHLDKYGLNDLDINDPKAITESDIRIANIDLDGEIKARLSNLDERIEQLNGKSEMEDLKDVDPKDLEELFEDKEEDSTEEEN